MFFLRKLMTNFADVREIIWAADILENWSMQTSMYFFVLQVKGNEPANSNSISWFGCTTGGSFQSSRCFDNSLRFLPALDAILSMNLNFTIYFRPPDVECRQLSGELAIVVLKHAGLRKFPSK